MLAVGGSAFPGRLTSVLAHGRQAERPLCLAVRTGHRPDVAHLWGERSNAEFRQMELKDESRLSAALRNWTVHNYIIKQTKRILSLIRRLIVETNNKLSKHHKYSVHWTMSETIDYQNRKLICSRVELWWGERAVSERPQSCRRHHDGNWAAIFLSAQICSFTGSSKPFHKQDSDEKLCSVCSSNKH